MAIGAAVTVAVATTGFTIVPASPAQATEYNCIRYIEQQGYVLTEQRRGACDTGASGVAGAWFLCYDTLRRTGMTSTSSAEACNRAGA